MTLQCALGGRENRVCQRGSTGGRKGGTVHPFVVRRPHRYAHQCESVRKTGS